MITHSPRTRHVFQSRTVCRTQFLWTRRPVRAPNHWMRFLGAANSPTEPLLPIPCPDAVVLASGSLWTVGSACIGTVFMSCRQLSNLVGSAGCKCTPGDMGEDGDPTQWHVVRPDAHITTVPMARAAPLRPCMCACIRRAHHWPLACRPQQASVRKGSRHHSRPACAGRLPGCGLGAGQGRCRQGPQGPWGQLVRARVFVCTCQWRCGGPRRRLSAGRGLHCSWAALRPTRASTQDSTLATCQHLLSGGWGWLGDEASVDVGTHNDLAVYRSMQQHMYGGVSKE